MTSLNTSHETRAGLRVTRLHPALGASIENVDFTRPLSATAVDDLIEAWMTYHVLVFPGQPITDPQHVEMTRYFGEPEVFHQQIIKSERVREIFRVANVDEQGNLMTEAHPAVKQLSSARTWHSDSSYRAVPAMGSLLHGIEVTAEGGVTCFANMHAVYDALPVRLRDAIANRKARHDFDMLSRLTGAPRATAEERAAMPPIWQPMVRKHPVTGRSALYISPIYNDKVEGLDDEDAEALIAELADLASEPRFVYEHHWRAHDILLWDNRCLMHRVTPHDPGLRRVMHRTTITGEEPVIAAPG